MKQTQCQAILKHLHRSNRPLTAAVAMRKLGIYRLAARIYDLRRRGIAVRSRLVQHGGRKWAAYWIGGKR